MKYLFILLSVVTTYVKSTYITEAEVSVDATQEEITPIIDRMIYEFQTNPELLFDWAFKGTGQQNDAQADAIVLALADVEYVPEEKKSRMVLNIDVDGKPKFKNIRVESQVTDSLEADTLLTRLDIHYYGMLFKTIYLNFRVKPIDQNHNILVMDTHLQFGWFFNIFVSRKVYRQVAEWRIDRFMNNVKEMIETGEVKDHEQIDVSDLE